MARKKATKTNGAGENKNALTAYMAKMPAVTQGDMAQALGKSAGDKRSGDGSGLTYLTFSGKSGNYSLGQQGGEPDGQYLLDPMTFLEGFICWKASQVAGRVEFSIYSPQDEKPRLSDMEDLGPYARDGDGWSEQLGFACVDLDDLSKPIKFTSNSKSGRNSIADLMDEVAVRTLEDDEPSNYPIITFDMVEFTAQDQKNFKPVFDVEAWVTKRAWDSYVSDKMSAAELLAGKAPRKRAAKKKAASRARR